MSIYKSSKNGQPKITPPKVGPSTTGNAQNYCEILVARTHDKLESGKIDVNKASAQMMDEVIPLWGTQVSPLENIECARDIIAAGAQDEFTEAALEAIQDNPEEDQVSLRNELRALALERNVFHLL